MLADFPTFVPGRGFKTLKIDNLLADYPLAIIGRRAARASEVWWRAGDLNPRPRRCERRALPTELAPHPISAVLLNRRNCLRVSAQAYDAAEETGRKFGARVA